MKKYQMLSLPVFLLALLLVSFGCRDQLPDTVHLVLNFTSPLGAPRTSSVMSTYEPEPEITEYSLTCSGPRSSSFTLTSSSSSTELKEIYAGEWTFSAEGLNSAGTVLISGERTVHIDKHTDSIALELEPAEGDGTLQLSVSWNDQDIKIMQGEVTLREAGSNDQPDVKNLTIGTAGGIYTDTIAAGDYVFQVELFDENYDSCGTAVFEATVYPGTTLNLNIPDITTHLTEVNPDLLFIDTTQRVTGSIAGDPYIIYEHIPIEFTYLLDDPDGTDIASLTLEWYLNGQIIRKTTGDAREIISPDAGIHRMDVIAYTPQQGSIASASLSFEALDYELTEDLMLIQVIEDGHDQAILRNVSDFTVTSRGEVITASKSGDLLQVFVPRHDGLLELLYTIEGSSGAPLHGVKAVDAAPDGSFICTLSEYDRSVNIFSYCYDSGTYLHSAVRSGSPGAGMEPFDLLSDVVISPKSSHIYVSDQGNDVIYHLIWDGIRLNLGGVQASALSPGLSSPRKMAINPAGTHLASTNRNNSSLQLFSIDRAGALDPIQSFSYSTDGTMGISQVNNAHFYHDGTLFTTSNNFLCRFSYDQQEFHYGYRIKQDDFDSCRMAGLRSVVTDPWREKLYVGSVTSRGITAFDINPDGSVEFLSFTPCAPIHQLHIDPAGNYLYAISASQHALFVFDIR